MHYFAVCFIDYNTRNCLTIEHIRLANIPKTKEEEWSTAIYDLFPQFRPYSFFLCGIHIDNLIESLGREKMNKILSNDSSESLPKEKFDLFDSFQIKNMHYYCDHEVSCIHSPSIPKEIDKHDKEKFIEE